MNCLCVVDSTLPQLNPTRQDVRRYVHWHRAMDQVRSGLQCRCMASVDAQRASFWSPIHLHDKTHETARDLYSFFVHHDRS